MIHTSYGVDTLFSLFSAIWRTCKHEIHNKYDTLFIYCDNNSRNTTKLFVIRIHVYGKRYISYKEVESQQTIHRLNQGIFKAKRKVIYIYMCTCTLSCN